jgi:hypothetical protein
VLWADRSSEPAIEVKKRASPASGCRAHPHPETEKIIKVQNGIMKMLNKELSAYAQYPNSLALSGY